MTCYPPLSSLLLFWLFPFLPWKGIHGNNNEDITITDVIFDDFEVAAVSLNNVDGLTIRNCEILKNRHDVPVVGLFSAARIIR